MRTTAKWVAAAVILAMIGNFPIFSALLFISLLLRQVIKAFQAGSRHADMLIKCRDLEGRTDVSLENAYNVDLDRDWVGVATARAETFILSGVFQERK